MPLKLVDAHCHVHELNGDELSEYCNSEDIMIIAVSDDLTSSLETLNISKRCSNIVPSVGIHPWNVSKASKDDLEAILENAKHVRFLGEVGIDKKFALKSYDKQLRFFKKFVQFASNNNLGVNVHAAGAWRDALKILVKYDVKVAIIHWYSGPTELISDISSLGYYITVNPAIKIQQRLREIVLKAPLTMILTESDAPYVYRGMRMASRKVLDVVNEIASIKGLEVVEALNIIFNNYCRVLKAVGVSSASRWGSLPTKFSDS